MTAQQEFSRLTLTQHPLSAAFPSMPESEIAALAIDIETHGQREPGVTLDGMVLDGWHRYLACHRLGVQFKATDYDGADPRSFVLSRNLHRRHLTASQRASAVVKCSEWHPGGRGALVQPSSTNAEMAKEADVGERTIVQAKRAEEVGLGDAVREGKVSARAAADVAKLPKKRREKAIKAIEDGEQPSLPKPRAVIASREVEKLYEEAKAELVDLKERYETLADTARDLSDKLTAFETTELDEQQKLIATLQKRIVRLEGEVDRVTVARNDANNKNNVLIREVKRLQKKVGAAQ